MWKNPQSKETCGAPCRAPKPCPALVLEPLGIRHCERGSLCLPQAQLSSIPAECIRGLIWASSQPWKTLDTIKCKEIQEPRGTATFKTQALFLESLTRRSVDGREGQAGKGTWPLCMYKRSLVDLNLHRHEESQSRQKALKAVAMSLFLVSPLPRPQNPLQQDLPAGPSALSHPTQGEDLKPHRLPFQGLLRVPWETSKLAGAQRKKRQSPSRQNRRLMMLKDILGIP